MYLQKFRSTQVPPLLVLPLLDISFFACRARRCVQGVGAINTNIRLVYPNARDRTGSGTVLHFRLKPLLVVFPNSVLSPFEYCYGHA